MVVTLGISNYVSSPIQLGAPQYLDFESRIALPKGFWSSVPPSVDEKKDFAEYSSSASLEDGVLRGTRHLKILRPKISPREIAEYSALHKTIVDDFGTWIVVVEGLGPQPHSYEVHGSKNPDAQRLFDEASQSMAMGAPFSASKSLEQALKLDPKWADAWAKTLAPIRNLLLNKYYFDWFNEKILSAFARGLGITLWKAGDQVLIDGALVNGLAATVGWFGSIVRRVQSGYLYSYAFWMVIGLAVMLGWFLVR